MIQFGEFLKLLGLAGVAKTLKGTASSFTSTQVLAAGQFASETDTGLVRVGDGVTQYSALPAINSYIVVSSWAARPTTGLADGQMGDFSQTFGRFAPLFRWDGTNLLWQPTGPLVLGTVVGQQVLETTTTAETQVGAAIMIPIGLLRAGGEVRVTGIITTTTSVAVAHTLKAYYDTAATGIGTGSAIITSVLNGSGANTGLGVDMKMDVLAPNNVWAGRNTNGWVGGQSTTFNLSTDNSTTPVYVKFSLQVAATGVDITLKHARVVYNPPGA